MSDILNTQALVGWLIQNQALSGLLDEETEEVVKQVERALEMLANLGDIGDGRANKTDNSRRGRTDARTRAGNSKAYEFRTRNQFMKFVYEKASPVQDQIVEARRGVSNRTKDIFREPELPNVKWRTKSLWEQIRDEEDMPDEKRARRDRAIRNGDLKGNTPAQIARIKRIARIAKAARVVRILRKIK